MMQIAYFTTKDFDRTLKEAFLSGGPAQKAALKAKAILGSLKDLDPFMGVPLTNHGENRIPNCVKYNLGGGWRLVTQQTKKTCGFLFVGDHEDVDRWLDCHRKQTFGLREGRVVLVAGSSEQITLHDTHRVDHREQPFVERLAVDEMDYVLDGLPRSVARRLEGVNGQSSAKDLEDIISQIADQKKAEFVRAIFALISAGDYEGAKARVDLDRGLIAPISDLDWVDTIDVSDGEDVRQLRIGSPEYEKWMNAFERRSPWYEWFLYLHPEQAKVVEADFSGTAQLSGVSGSGKTCVVVRRALRLAEAPAASVLLVTLNRSLAGLLRQLVDAACDDDTVRQRIIVTSFFELAQSLLKIFEPTNERYYSDVTWKLGEHVDEVFREYYRRWTNNDDASILLPLHKSTTARGVGGETYIREEFDWIRSAVEPNRRDEYLTLERRGRKFPISEDRRQNLLHGLQGWERKMRDVGVIDYLGKL